jgi:hypothetical protein
MRWILVSGVVGCGGGSLCERQADFSEDCGIAVADAEVEECEELLADCDGKDQKILGDYMECLEDVGLITCEPEIEEPDEDEILACVGEISGLSGPCLESFVSFDVSDDRTASDPSPP